jgi:hypothetical protein
MRRETREIHVASFQKEGGKGSGRDQSNHGHRRQVKESKKKMNGIGAAAFLTTVISSHGYFTRVFEQDEGEDVIRFAIRSTPLCNHNG